MNGGDDMADIAKKITKLDEKIGKLKERISSPIRLNVKS
jgi:hypothetical protein